LLKVNTGVAAVAASERQKGRSGEVTQKDRTHKRLSTLRFRYRRSQPKSSCLHECDIDTDV